ncbi:aBC transporter ATP-binding protein [Coprobacillus sp. CAG:698]|nr:aBC transporter ATP-binding protein [Coprobacillus sp. CAG:698]
MKKIFINIISNFSYTGKMLKLMWKSDKQYIVYLLLDIIVWSIIPFVNVYLVQESINMLETGADFQNYVPIIVGLVIGNLILNYCHNYLNYKRDLHGSIISVILYKNIFIKTLNLDYEKIIDKNIQEMRELSLRIIDNSRFSVMTVAFHNLVSSIIVITGISYLLAQIDLWILFIVLTIVIVNSISVIYRNRYERKVEIDINPIIRKIQYFMGIGSNYSYIKEMKLFSMNNNVVNEYVNLQKEMYKGVNKTRRLSLFGYTISHISQAILNIVIYLYLGYRVLVNKNLSIAEFSVFLAAVVNFNGSIQRIFTSHLQINNNGQYLKDYFEFMKINNIEEDESVKQDLIVRKYNIIEFKNVSYRYPNQENYAIKNLSLKFNTGEKLSIVGENGSGKTTLVMLLMRMIDPTEGEILFNGINIKNLKIDEYRKLFSTVFQDFKLFAFTIKENVSALSSERREDIDKKVNKALYSIGLGEKINSLPKGIYTYIEQIYDKDGILLSGGESQRIAIARALYKDSPIFILDEPTAALDPRVEYEIYSKFEEFTQNKTILYITHRLASTKFCNKIVVLKKGEVIELGTHNELMKMNGYYSELFNMQAQYYIEKSGTNNE